MTIANLLALPICAYFGIAAFAIFGIFIFVVQVSMIISLFTGIKKNGFLQKMGIGLGD